MNRKFVNKTLTHAVDIVPTILDMVGADRPRGLKFDGVSVRPLLDPNSRVQWPERFLITDSQRVRDPIKWKASSVMSERYRLINGKELYEIDEDPGQKNDLTKQ